MKETIALTVVFFLPAFFIILRNFLWDLYFWQIKEYRFDRVMVHLLWDQDEKNRDELVTVMKFVAFAMLTALFSFPIISILGIFFMYFVWLNELFGLFTQMMDRSFKKASIKSPRNILILSLGVVLVIGLASLIAYPFTQLDRDSSAGISLINNGSGDSSDYVLDDAYVLIGMITILGIVLDLASPVLVSLLVLLTSPVSMIKRSYVISQGRRKFLTLKAGGLKLVGITGSQGKTTTKDILYEILKNEVEVVKTPENYNTDFGVATAMLDLVKQKTELFIAEMGAYTGGEIRRLCQSFPPDISVITDMDTQHIGLFGSKENLIRAKGEIVEALDPTGIAILNGDNEGCLQVAKGFEGHKRLFAHGYKSVDEFYKKTGLEDDPKTEVFLATKIKHSKDKLSFTLVTKDIEESFTVNASGEHLVSNFMIAIIAANLLGLSIEDIKKKLAKINIKLPRLSIDTGDNDTIVVNDSYSSSLKGFIAAVNFMNKQDYIGKRVIITKGIYELGKEKEGVYEKLIKEIDGKFDMLVTSDNTLIRVVKNNMSKKADVYRAKNYKGMIFAIRQLTQKGDVILVEGRVNPRVLKELVSDNY